MEESKAIKDFLKCPDRRWLVLQYTGKRMNASCDWYKFRNPLRMLICALLNEVLMKVPPCGFKNSLYRLISVRVGKDVAICPNVSLDPLYPELITIEDGVTLGWGCKIFAHAYFTGRIVLGRIRIGEKALVGGYALLLPGVNIEKGATVPAGALVVKGASRNKTSS